MTLTLTAKEVEAITRALHDSVEADEYDGRITEMTKVKRRILQMIFDKTAP